MARPRTAPATVSSTTPADGKKPGAALPIPGSDVLYVVDLSGYVFRAYHAIAPLSSPTGEPTHAVLGTVNMLQKVLTGRRPGLLAVAMDSKGPTFRRELDARYKANRPPPPPDLSQQMQRCEEICRAQNFCVLQQDGVEADDLIASLVREADRRGVVTVVVSADKDLMQLVHDDDERVLMWDSMRDRVFGPAEVREKFGVPPSKVRDVLALMGDSSDNIPGVPGVGPKTATELVTEFGSVDGLYARVSEVKRAKLRESLVAAEGEARLSYRLVTLKDDIALGWPIERLSPGEPNRVELGRIYGELGFTRLLEAITPKAVAERRHECVLDEALLARIADEIRAAGVVAFDTETTGLDPRRAGLVGLSVSCTEGVGYYVPIAHRYLGAPAQIPLARVQELLAPIFADEAIRKHAHNAKFDEAILERHGMPVRGPVFDTMIASYLLDPETPNGLKELARRELGITMTTYDEVTKKQKGSQLPFDAVPCDAAAPYAAADAEVTFALAGRFEPRVRDEGLGALLSDVEMPLSRVLGAMERAGVLVDVAMLGRLSTRVEIELRALEARAMEAAGRRFSLRSRDELETILFDELGLPVVKRTPKGGRSTDAEVLDELADKHALPKIVLEYRELDKLRGTYLDALPRAVNAETGRIHTHFGQVTAATGRLASTDPNLQNIPIRTELGRSIREAFIAPEGRVLVSADYSQIELRVLAHLSHDTELVDAFRSGEDVHARTAMRVFGVDRAGLTPELRRRAKAINFGVIYGMGDSALGKTLGIPRTEAASFIEAYFERYAGVATFLAETVEAARRGEAVRTLLGRRRFLPNLHSANRGLRLEAERIAKNTPIQGTAADILKLAMVRLGAEGAVPGATMVLTVHDELVFEVDEGCLDCAKEAIKRAMETVLELDVPLIVDVGVGKSWAEAH